MGGTGDGNGGRNMRENKLTYDSNTSDSSSSAMQMQQPLKICTTKEKID